jgi:hypothetical protein
MLQKIDPAFDSRNYNYPRLSELARHQKYLEIRETASSKGGPNVHIHVRLRTPPNPCCRNVECRNTTLSPLQRGRSARGKVWLNFLFELRPAFVFLADLQDSVESSDANKAE